MIRVVYHATGGGHGHALRGAAVLQRLGAGTLVAPSRHAAWARACGVEFRACDGPADVVTEPAPDLLLVDVFPRGVVGELVPVLGRVPAWLVARRVLPDVYLHPPVRAALETCFERVFWTEEPPPELTGLRVRSLRVGPVLLAAPRLPRAAARAELGVEGAERLVLALGSSPQELQARQCRMLGKVTARVGATLRFVSDVLPGAVRLFPAVRWLPAADAVVSAAGYHAFHEIAASGVPAAFLPQERRFDDQAWRARAFPCPRDPEELEATLRDLLGRGRGDGLRLEDGAAHLARLVERRVQEGVLPEEEVAPVA